MAINFGFTSPAAAGQTKTASGYNVTPAPMAGQGAFGKVPGTIGVPSPFSDLSGVYPNLTGTNAAISSLISSKLRGELSPETINALQNAAATYGVESGMPGSGLMRNRYARDLGLTTEQIQQQGLQDYGQLIPTISGTQTVRPELQAEIAANNALNLSAPDPQAAQTYAQQLFDKYLNELQGPAGGTTKGAPWWTAPGFRFAGNEPEIRERPTLSFGSY